MSSIVVNGGRPLTGEVRVGGAKNSALKLMAAALLAPGVSTLTQRPRHQRRRASWQEVLSGLGAQVERSDHALTIDATELTSHEAPYELVAQMRASTCVLGSLVGPSRPRARRDARRLQHRLAQDRHAHPRARGTRRARSTRARLHRRDAPDGLRGAHVVARLPERRARPRTCSWPGCSAEGTTVIENAAREPEIVDLAALPRRAWARASRVRARSTIAIDGVERAARPSTHAVVGDRIEAGTFLVAGALDGGPVTVRGFDPAHLDMRPRQARSRPAATSSAHADGVTVARDGPHRPVDVATLPYPGFPTDMQAQFMALMAHRRGQLRHHRERVREPLHVRRRDSRAWAPTSASRATTRSSAASPQLSGRAGALPGPARRRGARARRPRRRRATTVVGDIHHIDRGYEGFVDEARVARRRHRRVDELTRARTRPTCTREGSHAMLDRDAHQGDHPAPRPVPAAWTASMSSSPACAPSASST